MILITGAANRIGAAIARRLCAADSGAVGGFSSVILHYHQSAADAEALAAELRGQGVRVHLWQQDLRAPDLHESFEKLLQTTGPITTLLNNAAVFYPDQDRVGQVTADMWHEVMTVNCHAPFVLMQGFAGQFSPPWGAGNLNIINILDQRVLNISHAFPAYTASKAALWALTQNMARALAPHIRVNAIAPGHVLPTAGEAAEKFEARRAKTPMGTGPAPEEIAEAAAFLLDAPNIIGICLPVDGGEHLVPKQK
jgi:NAD(P)-dependent dehydrogenase (short-subunit alcohol dehydrogenase family)